MAHLINNKGDWSICIEKSDNMALLTILSEMSVEYLSVKSQTPYTLELEFSARWGKDVEPVGEQHYRNLLSKISEFPLPDVIIPPDTIVEYKLLQYPGFLNELLQYPNSLKSKFLDELSTIGCDKRLPIFTEITHEGKKILDKLREPGLNIPEPNIDTHTEDLN